jgi:peptide deformylase
VPQELFGTAALHELIEVMRTTFAGKVLAVPRIALSLRLSVVEGTQALG